MMVFAAGVELANDVAVQRPHDADVMANSPKRMTNDRLTADLEDIRKPAKDLILLGERGGTRTLDPMIKSHVLYRLSYALT